MKSLGIDKAFLDISEIESPNKLLAKIASDVQKPNGLTIITEDEIERQIWPLPVRKLWGIGPKTEAYLKSIGIKTIW